MTPKQKLYELAMNWAYCEGYYLYDQSRYNDEKFSEAHRAFYNFLGQNEGLITIDEQLALINQISCFASAYCIQLRASAEISKLTKE